MISSVVVAAGSPWNAACTSVVSRQRTAGSRSRNFEDELFRGGHRAAGLAKSQAFANLLAQFVRNRRDAVSRHPWQVDRPDRLLVVEPGKTSCSRSSQMDASARFDGKFAPSTWLIPPQLSYELRIAPVIFPRSLSIALLELSPFRGRCNPSLSD
jgi:hypothetical protein